MKFKIFWVCVFIFGVFKFVENFSLIAKSLNDLVKKNVPFHYEEKEHNAFKMLKDRLINAPVFSISSSLAETELH